ncbi:MAG TPA: DNA polymerase IV [Ignavibacteria bacterium]|nr:DNA polymerase IV [Ignavibacteria bacterium]
MQDLSSSYFVPRENDLVHQTYKRVRMMPLYSFPCLKYFNLALKEHKDRFFIHFDLDCFYCQVETRDNPKYKGKPVGVISVSDSTYKGIVMTTNYEARALGIDIAMSVLEARMKCPELILINCYGQKYEAILNKIKKMIYNFVPPECLEQYSIDECFVDLSPVCKTWKQALDLAITIKQEIWNMENLTTSIGLSYNKTYSKIATKLQKPNGLTLITHENKEKILYDLPAEKIWGIGNRIKKRLNGYKINTIGDLANASEYTLRKEFGINGICYYRMARGEDTTEIFHALEMRGHEKSLMTQHSRDNATAYEPEIIAEIRRSIEYLCRKLRSKKLTAKGLLIVLRYDNLMYDVEMSNLSLYTNDERLLLKYALVLYHRIIKNPTCAVRQVGACVYDLQTDNETYNYDMFEHYKNLPFLAIDKIKERYGENAIRIGLNKYEEKPNNV